MFALNVVIILGSICLAVYLYLSRNFKYWTSRGIDGPKPVIFFGTIYQQFFKSFPELTIYNTDTYGKIHGQFMGTEPILVVAEPELVNKILVTDFHKFSDRHNFLTGDPINDRSLFNVNGNDWKLLRSIISPTFSSGKMRSMHTIIIECVKRLEEEFTKKTMNGHKNELEVKKLFGGLTMDVIASCAFGTKTDTYNETEKSEFIVCAEKVFRHNWRVFLFFLLMKTFPKVLEWTQFKSTDPKVENFFRSALTSMIANRKSMANRSKHNDYLQLMVNALNKTADNNSHITGNSAEEPDDTERIYGQRDEKPMNSIKLKGELTEDDILANTVLFLVAGYETTASLLSYLSYSLALNYKCQQKLYEEVMSFDGKYDYESIAKMPYLEACVAETLRLYNPLVVLFRMANEDYKLGDTGITIPKGMMVNLDVQSIHRNADYYPNPDRWDPERFLPENRDQLAPHSYMPFGIGPRNCVGMRFGLMEAKTAVVCLVQKFRFTRSVSTCVPLIPKKHEFILNCGEINIGVELRK